MKKNSRAGKVSEYGVKEKLFIFSCPYASALIRRIQIKLLISIEINKPSYVLCRESSLHFDI